MGRSCPGAGGAVFKLTGVLIIYSHSRYCIENDAWMYENVKIISNVQQSTVLKVRMLSLHGVYHFIIMPMAMHINSGI